MTINSRLKQSISGYIGKKIDPGYKSDTQTSDLYEKYIFEIVLSAARNESALVSYLDAFGNLPQSLLFRESPGQIYATDKPYTHAVIEFPNKPLLEAHVGIRVKGISQVSHECDVCVLYRDEADNCRVQKREPDCSKAIIAAECKHYDSELNLNLARSFIGLVSELQVEGDCYFVSNNYSASVAKLLAIRRLK